MLNYGKHKLLCDEFYKKFGYFSWGIISAQAGWVFFTFQKDIYFLRPLIFNKEKIFVRKMNSERYDFIKNQPKSKIRWVKVEFSLLLAGLVLFIINAFIYYGFIKG